jgi:hypothetical protein
MKAQNREEKMAKAQEREKLQREIAARERAERIQVRCESVRSVVLHLLCLADSYGQFQQHFTRAFFARKFVQSQTLSNKKLLKRLHKMRA